MQQLTDQHLSPTASKTLLNAVPEKICLALMAYAEEIEYPVEAVTEVAFT